MKVNTYFTYSLCNLCRELYALCIMYTCVYMYVYINFEVPSLVHSKAITKVFLMRPTLRKHYPTYILTPSIAKNTAYVSTYEVNGTL